ncbi:MAG: GNAT superfamily N-acetyltransferase [Chlamydiales bacterium]|jgi:GNAT superfamily N-acetyltransferase
MPANTISILDVTKSQYKAFSCGYEELDNYLKRFAKGNHKSKFLGSTYVLLDEEEPVVIGYYTVCMAVLGFEEIPEDLRAGLPHYPLPAARLCRLAVDTKHKGKGLGGYLLSDALWRVWQASKSLAACAVVVDAKDEIAKSFYLHYDFIPCEDKDLSLFLPMDTITKIFEEK